MKSDRKTSSGELMTDHLEENYVECRPMDATNPDDARLSTMIERLVSYVMKRDMPSFTSWVMGDGAASNTQRNVSMKKSDWVDMMNKEAQRSYSYECLDDPQPEPDDKPKYEGPNFKLIEHITLRDEADAWAYLMGHTHISKQERLAAMYGGWHSGRKEERARLSDGFTEWKGIFGSAEGKLAAARIMGPDDENHKKLEPGTRVQINAKVSPGFEKWVGQCGEVIRQHANGVTRIRTDTGEIERLYGAGVQLESYKLDILGPTPEVALHSVVGDCVCTEFELAQAGPLVNGLCANCGGQ